MRCNYYRVLAAPTYFIKDDIVGAPTPALRLFLYLASGDRAKHHPTWRHCEPKTAAILACETGLSAGAVSVGLAWLVEHGYIKVERR